MVVNRRLCAEHKSIGDQLDIARLGEHLACLVTLRHQRCRRVVDGDTSNSIRLCLLADYESGIALFRVNPSCGTVAPLNDCHDPLGLDLRPSPRRAWVRWVTGKDNAVSRIASPTSVRIEFAIYNSDNES